MDSGTEHSFTATNEIPSQTIQIINSRLERQQLETLSFVEKLFNSVQMPFNSQILLEDCIIGNEKR